MAKNKVVTQSMGGYGAIGTDNEIAVGDIFSGPKIVWDMEKYYMIGADKGFEYVFKQLNSLGIFKPSYINKTFAQLMKEYIKNRK